MPIAILALSLGLTLAPAVQDTDLAQAERLLEDGRLEEAAAELRTLLESGQGDARDARMLLAEVHLAAGDAPAAIDTLDALGLPNDYGVALALGSAYIAWADQLAARTSSDDDVRLMLIDASHQLEQAVSLAPAGDVRATVQLGNVVLYRLGEHERAISMADEALAVSPDDGELLLLRGCAGVFRYWNAKQAGDQGATEARSAWQQSVDDLTAAAAALPRGRTEPWGQLVWLHEDKGEAVEAVEAAIQIVNRDPDASFDMLYRLAVRYSFERSLGAAGKAMEAMVGLSAREITRRLGREQDLNGVATELGWSIDSFVSRNDPATARAILAAIVAAKPTNPVIWDNYAVMCQQTSRFEDAAEAYEHLLTFERVDPRVYNDLGAVLQYDLERDPSRAQRLYQHCIDLAEGELAGKELAPERREHLELAVRVAKDNLDGTDTRQGGGLLGGLMGLLGGESPAGDTTGSDTEGSDDTAGTDDAEDADDAGNLEAKEPTTDGA